MTCVAGGWREGLGLKDPHAPDSRGFAAYEFCLRAPTRPPATQAIRFGATSLGATVRWGRRVIGFPRGMGNLDRDIK